MTDQTNFYSIVERLRILEEGLDKNQKSVNQLSATFKPKTVAVLTAKTDPKNPMAGKMVGGCEEGLEAKMKQVEEEASQDMLSKVKDSFKDYLSSLEDSIKQDKDLIAKKKEDLDLRKKELKDLELQHKEHEESLEEDPSQEEPVAQASADLHSPTYAESTAPVKSVMIDENDESSVCEIYGDEGSGFEVRRQGRVLPSKFKSLSDAEMALDMFKARRAEQQAANANADYIEEK